MNKKRLFEIKKFLLNRKKCEPKALENIAAFFFTDRKKCPEFLDIIKNLAKNTAVIFREYDLEKSQRYDLAFKIAQLCRKNNCKILIGKDYDLALKVKADGVHFSDLDDLGSRILKQKNFRKDLIFSLSCHNLQSAFKAQNSRADLIFLSPIFPTTSHFDKKNIGLRNLIKLKNFTKKPVFALGGVNKNNINLLNKGKIRGFGAIDFFK